MTTLSPFPRPTLGSPSPRTKIRRAIVFVAVAAAFGTAVSAFPDAARAHPTGVSHSHSSGLDDGDIRGPKVRPTASALRAAKLRLSRAVDRLEQATAALNAWSRQAGEFSRARARWRAQRAGRLSARTLAYESGRWELGAQRLMDSYRPLKAAQVAALSELDRTRTALRRLRNEPRPTLTPPPPLSAAERRKLQEAGIPANRRAIENAIRQLEAVYRDSVRMQAPLLGAAEARRLMAHVKDNIEVLRLILLKVSR